jgi:SAM-dependent methyltransferase
VTDQRAHARGLAASALADGQPLRWFEELYAGADTGDAVVPWADLRPNRLLLAALEGVDVRGLRTLVVGCGYGDDAAHLARCGAQVTAFDIAPSAVARAAGRFPDLPVTWTVGNALEPAPGWRRAFDLVVEIFTLQVLPPELRAAAGVALGDCVADGGRLLVICRGREPGDPAGEMPWPLTVAEVRALAADGLEVAELRDFLDDEDPPVRRLVAWLRRSGR